MKFYEKTQPGFFGHLCPGAQESQSRTGNPAVGPGLRNPPRFAEMRNLLVLSLSEPRLASRRSVSGNGDSNAGNVKYQGILPETTDSHFTGKAEKQKFWLGLNLN